MHFKEVLKNNFHIILIFTLSLFIAWPIFLPGYFSHHDDLQVMRIFEMRKCLTDFQIPCRWVPDMGYGNGYPLFNFYGVFAYYLGAILSFIFGFVISAKILFLVPLLLGGVGMYLLAREIFGDTPGFVAAVLYTYAPYRALDIYVRGAVAESFAMTAVPFVLFFILKLTKTDGKKYFLMSAISFGIFLLSHNIMTLLFSPVMAVITFYFILSNKYKNWWKILIVFLIGFGLSAFFVLPAFFEKGLVQTDSLTRAELDFRAQFVKIGQLFIDRSWHYAGSSPNSLETISYQIGWPHWWLVIAAFASLFIVKKRKKIFLPIILIILFATSVLMTHNQSSRIWELVKILAFVQFPWRFLSIVIFAACLLGGYLTSILNNKLMYAFAILVTVLTVALNWQYFRPEHFYFNITDKVKLSGQNFVDQQKGSLLDYLPKTALEPRERAPTLPIIKSGESNVVNFVNKTNYWSFDVDVKKASTIDIPVFDFPNWVTYIDGKKTNHDLSKPLGRIEVNLQIGKHTILGKFTDTPVRVLGNSLTLISFVSLIFLLRKNRYV